MKIKAIAIDSFAKFIMGGLAFSKVKDIVKIYSDTEMSGEEKRAGVLKDLKDIGMGLSVVVLNLGIELAVLFMQEQGLMAS